MGLFGSLGKLAKGALGIVGGPVGGIIGAGLGLLGGAKAESRGNKLSDRAFGIANQRYQQGAPMRARLNQLAMNLPREREDLSSLFADAGNPYSRAVPRPRSPLAAQEFPQVPTVQQPTGGGGGILGRRPFFT